MYVYIQYLIRIIRVQGSSVVKSYVLIKFEEALSFTTNDKFTFQHVALKYFKSEKPRSIDKKLFAFCVKFSFVIEAKVSLLRFNTLCKVEDRKSALGW